MKRQRVPYGQVPLVANVRHSSAAGGRDELRVCQRYQHSINAGGNRSEACRTGLVARVAQHRAQLVLTVRELVGTREPGEWLLGVACQAMLCDMPRRRSCVAAREQACDARDSRWAPAALLRAGRRRRRRRAFARRHRKRGFACPPEAAPRAHAACGVASGWRARDHAAGAPGTCFRSGRLTSPRKSDTALRQARNAPQKSCVSADVHARAPQMLRARASLARAGDAPVL
jgi:hypothetical protein